MKQLKQAKQAEKDSWVVKLVKQHGVFDIYTEDSYNKLFELMKLKMKLKPGMTVLDVGCGTGAFAFRFARRGLKVTGIDLSPELVEIAKKTAKRRGLKAKFLAGDAERLPFKKNCFDAVFFGTVLHHFPDFSLALKEAKRVLKPGGIVFALEPNAANPHVWLSMSQDSPLRYEPLTANERAIPLSELKENFVREFVSVEKHFLFMRLRRDEGLYYKVLGFVLNSYGGFVKRVLAFFAFNFVHFVQCFLSGKRNANCVFVGGLKPYDFR